MTEETISILSVDDQPMIGHALGAWLSRVSRFEWLGWLDSGAAAEEAVGTMKPDVVLMDYDLPGEDTATIIARLSVAYPRVKVVVLSAHCKLDYIQRALEAGAAGYLLKDEEPAAIAAAIRSSRQGRLILSDAVRALLSNTPVPPMTRQPRST